jgi:membrane-associated phospholipid phosphatase
MKIVSSTYSLEEIVTLCMLLLLNLAILLCAQVDKAAHIFLLNTALIAVIVAVSRIQRIRGGQVLTFIRDWYVLPLLITIYLEQGRLIPLINPHDVDGLLIEIDRALFFGHDPTALLERFIRPLTTELLQIVYASFYLLPFSLCVIIYLHDRKTTFHVVAATIIIGFYISYIGYYLTPAIGPRFTLAHLQHIPLTGLLSFNFIRSMLDAAAGVVRDCCPSGHTMVSLLTVLLAGRYEKRFLAPAVVWTALLMYSTMYLRYHYATDLIVGIVLAGMVFLFVPAIERWVVARMNRQSSFS